MTDNMDEFEQEQFDTDAGLDGDEPKAQQGSFFDRLRSKPVFKLIVIVGVVGVAVAGALGLFSSKPDVQRAQIAPPPEVKGTAGGSASPFYVEQNKIANEQRVDEAIKQKGSALPTPVSPNSDMINLDDLNKKDPLVEFRAETDRLKQELRAEQQQNTAKIQMMQQQMQQQPQRQQDDTLAQAMQRQMSQLMESWTPRKMTTVAGAPEPERSKTDNVALSANMPAQAAGVTPASATQENVKPIISSGTVNYAQLLTEANSDLPGPVMVQLLSGPFAGGRAIGTFKTMYENLVLSFNVVSYKGKEYPINAIALNPDTTLSGMATEVDHRYFMRLVLPAAASFLSSFGSALGSSDSTTTVSGDAVLVDNAKKSSKEAMYDGLSQVGQTMAGFFQQEAAQTKTLVRVAAGTPMGIFFLQPVMDKGVNFAQPTMAQGTGQTDSNAALQSLLAQGYQQAYPQQQGYGQAYGQAYGQQGVNTMQNPYATQNGYLYPSQNSSVIDLSTLPRNAGGAKIYYSR